MYSLPSSSLFVSSSTSTFNLTWSKTLFLFHVIKNTFFLLRGLFYVIEDILSCPAFYFLSVIVVARTNLYMYVCVCVCVRCFFFLFSENSVIPSLLLHKQNKNRSPWDSNFLWLIYPAVIRASFFCRFICRISAMPFSSVCIALIPCTFISRASLFASSVWWRFVGFYSFVYC